ncbi:large T antigen [Bat polyomavirus 6a]|uniref:DNA 3'-5' helicase n=1 Tax=Bat polyomavirus 6a TaxID=1623685 RepID=A0A0D5ZZ24_9POLY|nr:large T antigen [Bat polyomavirus 6a]BAQ55552.1 large T antigen [Bat polyomavirus 6a]
MDHALTREESVRLMQLLKLPMEQYGNFSLMRKAFLRECKNLHPDKGGNPELAKELITLYRKLEEQAPPYGTPEWDRWWEEFNDLFCHETFDRSDDEEEQRKRPASPESEPECSQATPPKKKKKDHPKDMPEDLQQFLSNAILSNKTVSSFLIFTTAEKSTLLYGKLRDRFKATFVSRHKQQGSDGEAFVFLITPSRHRVSAINNFCNSLCSVSFIIVKGVIKEYNLYVHLCVEPYVKLQESIPGGLSRDFFDTPEEAAKNVSWKMIAEFALDLMCDDIFLLMGMYKEFAEDPKSCAKCEAKIISDHFQNHFHHYENALLFLDCRNQKAICQQAVDGVIAHRRVQTAQLSREQQLAERFKKLFEKMENLFGARSKVTLRTYMAGVAWFDSLFPDKSFKELLLDFLECMVNNVPKKRYWFFTGPVNTGKTTLAAALLDLCGGKSLNVNMPFEKLNFELGVAIDQFMVIFEDVKGQVSENKNLPTGQGINNLDHLRDYLDGAVKVNLEKKHLNKKSQIFPPGIVTANEYKVPFTLRVRFCKTLTFQFRKNLYLSLRKTEDLGTYRVLQNGICLLLFLVYHCEIEDFSECLHKTVEQWKERISQEVSLGDYLDFKSNIQKGNYILQTTESQGPSTQECETEDFVN